MKTGVKVSAAVLNNRQTKIGVRGFEQSGEDYTAGGDTVEHQGIDVIGTENHGKIGSGKCTHPMFRDDYFAFFRGNESRDRPERLLKQFLMLRRRFDGAEKDISRTDLR